MEKDVLINNVDFKELEKRIYKLVCQLGCEILKNIIETQDKKLMENRDKKIYRHKGYRQNTIKTVMGEVEYKRGIYQKEGSYVFLLDDTMNIETIGKISNNLAEIMLKTVVNTTSYRKGANEIKNMTNETISHQALNQLVWNIGKKLENKENEEIKLYNNEKLVKGTKIVNALFEEADGLWINLQGKDREKAKEKYINECKKNNKKYDIHRKFKSEVKLHITYEGWKKDSNRHELINKRIITGVMTSSRLKKLRNARVYQEYDESLIELRAMNGDGANWINILATSDTISQKDLFHIQQEITRDISEKQYIEELSTIIKDKKYKEVLPYIENLKFVLGGEVKTVEKLQKLQDYLKTGLPRYQDILNNQGRSMPIPPSDVEYRDMGTMESNIFSVLKVRLCSGRKAFLKLGANYLAKICAIYYENDSNIEICEIKSEIPIDNSIEEWIIEIEKNVKKNKKLHRSNRKMEDINNYGQCIMLDKTSELKQILKLTEPTALMYR